MLSSPTTGSISLGSESQQLCLPCRAIRLANCLTHSQRQRPQACILQRMHLYPPVDRHPRHRRRCRLLLVGSSSRAVGYKLVLPLCLTLSTNNLTCPSSLAETFPSLPISSRFGMPSLQCFASSLRSEPGSAPSPKTFVSVCNTNASQKGIKVLYPID